MGRPRQQPRPTRRESWWTVALGARISDVANPKRCAAASVTRPLPGPWATPPAWKNASASSSPACRTSRTLGCWVAGWFGWPGGGRLLWLLRAAALALLALSSLSPFSSSPLLSSPPALTSAGHSCLVVRHQQWCCIAAAAIVERSVAHGESRRDARPLPSPLSSLLSPLSFPSSLFEARSLCCPVLLLLV